MLRHLPDRFAFAGDLRFKGSDADRGLRIVVGETEEELAEFAGEAIATRLVGDPAAFLSELGERGVCRSRRSLDGTCPHLSSSARRGRS